MNHLEQRFFFSTIRLSHFFRKHVLRVQRDCAQQAAQKLAMRAQRALELHGQLEEVLRTEEERAKHAPREQPYERLVISRQQH